MSKIMNVYYGQDTLPYKDKECQVHFPIIGQTFSGSSLVDTIKFYVDNIGGTSSITWVAIVKRADGSIAYQQLSDNFDSDGVYVSLPLVSYYTEKKGDIYITLNGYMGGVTVTEDENNVYHVEGTPIVQVSGAIKLTIAYAPTMPQNAGALEIITVQSALAAVTEKLDKNSPYFIKVVSNIDSNVINTPTYLPYLNSGDIVYSDYNKKFYKISGVAGSYVATEVELELGSLEVGTLDISTGINVDSFDDIYSENEENNLKGYIANQLSGYVEKSYETTTEVYGHSGSTPVRFPVSQSANANSIPLRTSGGEINVPNVPSDNTKATSKGYVDNAISQAVSSVYKYKGSVATYDDLPSSDLTIGDVYNVEDTGDNYAWTGTAWDKLAGTVDLSDYYDISQIDALLSGKQNILVNQVNIKSINGNSLLGSGNINIQGGSGATWGSITGTLSDQTDLNNELQDIRETAEGKCKTYIISYDALNPRDSENFVPNRYKTVDGTYFQSVEDLDDYLYESGSEDFGNESFNYNDDNAPIDLVDCFIVTTDYVVIPVNDHNILKKGDIILVVETDVPDRWFEGIEDFYPLETSKVDLTNYATKSEVNAKSDLTNVAPAYDNTLTYTIGEVVINPSGKLVKANTNISTPETYDSTHWDIVSVASDFVNLTGTQTITGEKTFSNTITANKIIFPSSATCYIDNSDGRLTIRQNDDIYIYTKRFEPFNNNSTTLGYSNRRWKDLYLAGGINPNTNGYKLTIPDTTSWTANKEIATTDQITPQWYGTQAQYDALSSYDSNTIYNILES